MASEENNKNTASRDPGYKPGSQTERKMTNQDFRVLLMTHRSSKIEVPTGPVSESTSKKQKYKKSFTKKIHQKDPLKKAIDEEDKMAEKLDSKYRDRAKERREGILKEDIDIRQLTALESQPINTISRLAIGDPSENELDVIEKSKYLSGDADASYLVKGLDYALLKKVRLENIQDGHETIAKSVDASIQLQPESSEVKFNSLMARNIYNIFFEPSKPANCDLFYPGRMTYVFCLEEGNPDSIVPTTVIRSKFEVSPLEKRDSISASDIVIKKLAHVLSYLRKGHSTKKVTQKLHHALLKNEPVKPKDDINIFDDVGVYDPIESLSKYQLEKSTITPKTGSYFETKPDDAKISEEKNSQKIDSISEKIIPLISTDKNVVKNMASHVRDKKVKSQTLVPDSYAECYPGAEEMMDATIDSEDEADFTKMDPGRKKSIVNRWDFDNEEDYGRYLDSREAMPKAAYQYGLKTKDGRKTKRKQQEKQKAKLDREFEQISKMIAKRSAEKGSDTSIPAPNKKKRL